ncbi:MAG TPA: hypothetical protein VI338_05255 [Nitrososphaera sp.]|nr:hypothetical protein [Nitrososphaera sp.]
MAVVVDRGEWGGFSRKDEMTLKSPCPGSNTSRLIASFKYPASSHKGGTDNRPSRRLKEIFARVEERKSASSAKRKAKSALPCRFFIMPPLFGVNSPGSRVGKICRSSNAGCSWRHMFDDK